MEAFMLFRFIFLTLIYYSYVALAVDGWSGSSYSQFSTSQANDASILLDQLGNHQRTEKIWVFGCGTGNNLAQFYLRLSPSHIYANDISKSMIEKAKERFDDHQDITIEQLDAIDFEASSQIDLAISVHVLHWIPREKIQQLLSVVDANLTAGGKFAGVFSASKEGLPFQNCLDDLKGSNKYKNHFLKFVQAQTFYQVDELRGLLTNKGFTIEILTSTPRDKIFADFPALKGFVAQWLSEYKYLKEIDSVLSERFLDDLMQAYMKLTNQHADKEIHWREKTLTLIARKSK
jgi:trans-aconitate methyltransferase